MEQFQKLGAQIEGLWLDKNYDESVFPEIAYNALMAANLPQKVSIHEVIEWTLDQTVLPEQRDLQGRFGNPPITLYNSPRFHIDVYFWFEGTTSIHQHGFCGAFQVMHGSSIHSHYEFETHQRVNVFTEIGELNLKTVEYLEVGKARQILAGRQYIHGLFHLDQPSVTIVVRTYKIPLFLPQYNYYKPSLAIDPFFEEPNITKKLQCLTALIRLKHPDMDKYIGELLRKSDFQTAFIILSTVHDNLQRNQIDQIFNQSETQNQFEKYLEIVNLQHGSLAEVFPKIFAHQSKVSEIVKRRGYVTDPEQRFFLALLMNVEGKERILSLVKERFPEAEPIEKVLDWTFDLAQTRILGGHMTNALGMADFDNLDLFILENILRDKSEEEMQATFKAKYSTGDAVNLEQDFTEKIERIKQSVIFESLLIID